MSSQDRANWEAQATYIIQAVDIEIDSWGELIILFNGKRFIIRANPEPQTLPLLRRYHEANSRDDHREAEEALNAIDGIIYEAEWPTFMRLAPSRGGEETGVGMDVASLVWPETWWFRFLTEQGEAKLVVELG